MKIKKNWFSTVAFVLLITGVLFPGENKLYAQSNTHTVQQGETLFSIARQYDISVADLRQWNNLENDNLQPGRTLQITQPERQGAITHTVQPGETLYSLSREYNVTIAEIQQWNNLQESLLDLGTELIIYPDEEEVQQEMEAGMPDDRTSIVSDQTQLNTYYTVKSGDNLTRIAQEHNMTLEDLRALNNLPSDMISIGQQLIVKDSQYTPVVESGNEESTPQGKFVTYRLQSGEDTSTLLTRYNLTTEELAALNPVVDVTSLGPGQQVTILLPPTRAFPNPYRKQAGLQDLGSVQVLRYSEEAVATPTSSGELYNPDQLTAAHSNMALGNVIYIENPSSGKGIFVKINDRHSGEGIKLSGRAYELLEFSSIERPTAAIYLDEQ